MKRVNANHYVKSVHIRSYSRPHFPAFGLNTGRYKVPDVIQEREWFRAFLTLIFKKDGLANTTWKIIEKKKQKKLLWDFFQYDVIQERA